MKNWAGNYTYRARVIHEPTGLDELREIVARTPRLKVFGSRHSFNDISDTSGELLSLARMPPVFGLDRDRLTLTVHAGARYGDISEPLAQAGFALANLGSLPHISVAGAVATATHGSGRHLQSLASSVAGMTLVTPAGELATFERGNAEFDGAVVSLGALGVVVEVTLVVEPAYDVRQWVFNDLPLAEFEKRFEEISALGYSVSFFSDWRKPTIDQLWIKQRVDRDTSGSDDRVASRELFGATAAAVDQHPIRYMSAAACTPQRGVPGAWHARLPHFRMDHTPSAGAELQSEYLVSRADAIPAFEALRSLSERLARLVQVTEMRTIAADPLWLSPAYERDTAAIHFTWLPDWPSVRAILPDVEALLRPFEPRPHWGKLFAMDAAEVRARYARADDFTALVSDLDPTGKFTNEFVARYVTAASSDDDRPTPR